MNQLGSNVITHSSRSSSWATGKLKYLVLVVAACLALLTLGAPLGASSANATVSYPIPRYSKVDKLPIFIIGGVYCGEVINEDGDVPEGYFPVCRWGGSEIGWYWDWVKAKGADSPGTRDHR